MNAFTPQQDTDAIDVDEERALPGGSDGDEAAASSCTCVDVILI